MFGGTILLNELLIRHKLIRVNNYLPQFIAIVFMINAPWSGNHLKILLSSILSCIAIYRTIGLYNKSKHYLICFEIGLIYSFATCLTHSFWTSIILGIISIGWVKTTTIRDYLAFLVGFFYVIITYFVIGYLIDIDFLRPFLDIFQFNIPKLGSLNSINLASFIFVSVISLFLIFKGITGWDKQNVKTRLHYRIWLFYILLLGPSLTFYFPQNPLENTFLFLGFPIAVLSIETLNSLKKKYLITILSSVIIISSILIRCL
jgi:hypothetical protein